MDGTPSNFLVSKETLNEYDFIFPAIPLITYSCCIVGKIKSKCSALSSVYI
jgi:hypothetical protein